MQSRNSVVIYSGREIDALNIRSKESHRSVIFPRFLPYDLVEPIPVSRSLPFG
jgi:hypothetical protein